MAIYKEEIILQSLDDDTEKVRPPTFETQKIQHEISFKNHENIPHQLYLYNHNFLMITWKKSNKDQPKNIAFHVGFLSPKHSFSLASKTTWLYLSLSLAIIALGLHLSHFPLLTVITTVITALSCLFIYFRSIKLYAQFKTINANAPIISIPLTMNKGRKNFLSIFSKIIESNPLPEDLNALARETELLRECCLQGLMTKEEYKGFRELIFSQYSKYEMKTVISKH